MKAKTIIAAIISLVTMACVAPCAYASTDISPYTSVKGTARSSQDAPLQFYTGRGADTQEKSTSKEATSQATNDIKAARLSLQAESDEDIQRYTVLLLDTCGSTRFTSDGILIYTADSAVSYVKAAASKFKDSLLSAKGDNYLAVISYNWYGYVKTSFTNDSEILGEAIDNLSSAGEVRNMGDGFDEAYRLLSDIPDGDNIIKNVVLCSTGMVNAGSYTYYGHYDSSVVGNSWYRSDTDVKLYAYANGAYNSAEKVKGIANVYSMGIFQPIEGMPDEGKDIAELFRLTAKDMASAEENFYNVEDVDNIEFTFGEIADTLVDTDGDGLYDTWEQYGVDTDGDGEVDLHLEQMGADPNVPDLFVEVDWMVRPSSHFLWWETQPELNLQPTQNSMELVYKAFKKHGINLHIDVGPDSKDFVTGKNWGSLSGGNEIPYEEDFILGERNSHWMDVAEDNFALNRRSVFRHCIFLNQWDGTGSSGVAIDIPGQFFIVANRDFVRDMGDTGIGGTFMHELGHTLGLSHGGFDDEGENNHTQYSPAYLSVMNYSFQLSGLGGTGALDYSDYSLPALDEDALIESNGIDPWGSTTGTGLTTRYYCNSSAWFGLASGWRTTSLDSASVDFDDDGSISTGSLRADINDDGEYTMLYGNRDWGRLVYRGGNVGFAPMNVNIAGAWATSDGGNPQTDELTVEEALAKSAYGSEGDGALELKGPYTLIARADDQAIVVSVKNLGPTDCEFILGVAKCAATSKSQQTVFVPGSTEAVSSVDVVVPIEHIGAPGDYTIPLTLTNGGAVKAKANLRVEAYDPTDEEVEQLKAALDTGDTGLPEDVANTYESTLSREVTAIAVPKATKGLKYTGKKRTGVKAGVGYMVTGGTAKKAGSYTATVVPKFAYRWPDGTRDAKSIRWKIAKAAQSKVKKSASIKKTVKGCKKGSLASAKSFKVKVTGIKDKAKATFKLKSAGKLKGKVAVSKEGKVTVKKGARKGSYTLKVAVKLSATENMKAKTVKRIISLKLK